MILREQAAPRADDTAYHGAAARLKRWHQLVDTRDLASARPWLADTIEFHSPVLSKPKVGPDDTLEILNAVGRVMKDFTYCRELAAERTWVLEFEAVIEDTTSDDPALAGRRLSLKGVDIVQWDRPCWEDAARIVHFEVMVRPLPVLQVLKNEMVKALMG